MKLKILFCLFFFAVSASAQTKQSIDSINKIVVHEFPFSSDSMVKLFKNNLKDAQALNYLEGIAGSYDNLSLVYSYKGDYPKSTEYDIKAIGIYEKMGQTEKVAQKYGGLGWTMKRRDLPNAILYMQKGIRIAQKSNFEKSLKDLYNNYGVIKQWNGEIDSAAYYFEEGLKIKQKIGDDLGIPYSLSNLAGAYLVKKQHQKAKDLLTQSIRLREKLKDTLGLSENYTQLAEVYLDEKDYTKAIQLFKQSVPLAKKLDYKNLEQYNYQYLAESYKNIKMADSALYYFQKHITLKDSIFNIQKEEQLAKLTKEFETEKKDNEILRQKNQITQSALKIRQKNLQIYGSIGLLIIASLLGYLLYNQQKLKLKQVKKEAELQTALVRIETQNQLQEQRIRISRDLHDNIGAQLTFIISSVDNLAYAFGEQIPKIKEKLSNISTFTRGTIYELRDTIWAMNKEKITLEDLQVRLNNFIDNANLSNNTTQISFQNNLGNTKSDVDALHGIHLYRIIQEAIHNSFKYAKADEILVEFNPSSSGFQVSITDNGIGFNLNEMSDGYGLKNIKKRSKEAGFDIKLTSSKGKGTQVILQVKNT